MPPCCHSGEFMLANNSQRSFHGEDALKALTMLEQLALPVELNATLEPAADFAKASTAPATGQACGSEPRNIRAAPSAAVDIEGGD
jgi:hypothetical protein